MDGEGDIWYEDLNYGKYREEDKMHLYAQTQILNAGFGDHIRMIYYLELLDGSMLASTDPVPDNESIDENSKFALLDLDEDGIEELIISGEWD